MKIMVKYPQMKIALIAIVLTFAAVAARVALPPAPAAEYADTEAATNAALVAADVRDNRFSLSLELNAATNSAFRVELGEDTDGDGKLGAGEIGFALGWDCGAWFYRDLRSGAFGVAEGAAGRKRLEWVVALRPDKSAKSVDATCNVAAVFGGGVPATFFREEWNRVRLVRNGAAVTDEAAEYSFTTAPLRIILR